MLSLICLIVALVLFAIAAFNIAVPKINLIAGGLFFMVLAQLVVHIVK